MKHFLLGLGVALAIGCAPVRDVDRTPPTPALPATSVSSQRATPPRLAAPALASRPDAAPPYDLAADIAERGAVARRELGEKTQIALVEDVFVVIGAPNWSRGEFSGSLLIVEKALAAYFNGRFSRRPERAISVYLFPSQASYDRYCRTLWDDGCGTPYGVYVAARRAIVMNVGPGIGTLTHELVHPLIETDFPDAPDWLNEGIASLFERFHFPKPGEIAGGKNWRHPRLVHAFASSKEREHATLEALFTMSDQTFRGEREDLNYATARYFCQWMDHEKWLWPFYRRWRDGYATDPSGEQAFVAVTGMTPAEATPQWRRWVRAL